MTSENDSQNGNDPQDGVESVSFLPDRPISEPANDALEHRSVARTLGDVLAKWKHEEGPFTVGLFGSWGTGKSGIGRLLRTEFIDPTKTAVVEFDIWKYESDSFRRQFLIFLDDKTGLNTGLEKLKKIYESSSHIEQQNSLSPDKNSWVRLLVPIAIATVGVAMFFAADLTVNSVYKWILQILGGVGTFTAIAVVFAKEFLSKVLDWFFSAAKGVLKVHEITVTEHRIEFAEQFEKLFESIIDAKIKQGFEKVVIIIDNLDRVSDEKILQLLSSVKTFLEYERVAFLIQCDEKAIKRHLLHIYHKESNNKESETIGERYTDEFLRKFFNTYVRIPPVLAGDLDRFTGGLIAETKLPMPDEQTRSDLLAVISSSHRDNPNPRKIKQFINALISSFLLAHHRENDGNILQPRGVVTRNIQMLAKVMVIEQRYPDFFNDLKQEPGLWNVVDRHIVENKIPEDDKLRKRFEHRGDDSLYRFLLRTKFITTNNISPFIFLKQSEDSRRISTNAEKLTEALQDGDDDKVTEMLGKAETGSPRYLEQFIIENIENVKSSAVRVYNIINTFFSNNTVQNIGFSSSFLNRIAAYILGTETESTHYIEGFRLPVLFDYLMPRVNGSNRLQLAKKYVSLLERVARAEAFRVNIDDDTYRKQLLKKISDNPELFSEGQIEEISSILGENSLLEDLDNADIFIPNLKARKAYIRNEHLERIVRTITSSDLSILDITTSPLLRKVRLVLTAESTLNEHSINALFHKLSELAAQQPAIGDDRAVEIVNTAIRESLEKVDSRVTADQITALTARLRQNYDQNNNPIPRVAVTTNLLILRGLAVEHHDDNIEPLKQYTNEILTSSPVSTLEKVLSATDFLNKPGPAYDNLREILESRSFQDHEVFRSLSSHFDAQHKESFLARTIKNAPHYLAALEQFTELRKVTNPELVANCTLSRAQRENFPEKITLMTALPKIKFNEAAFKKVLVAVITKNLESTNTDHQRQMTELVYKYKIQGYLTKSEMEEITSTMTEYLEHQNLSGLDHYAPALSLISQLPMTAASYERLGHILINHILMRSMENKTVVERILNIAKEANITYSDNKQLFEKVYDELTRKGREVQKYTAHAILEYGLVNKRSKEFYERIEKMAA